MKSPKPTGVSIAVIRVLAQAGPRPVIRIFELNELFGPEHVLATTTSPDEALSMVRHWLNDVVRGGADEPRR